MNVNGRLDSFERPTDAYQPFSELVLHLQRSRSHQRRPLAWPLRCPRGGTMADVESHPDAWDDAAVRLVAQWITTSDPGLLNAAITLLRHAVDAGSGDRSRYLSHLGSALSYRHQLAGDADSLRAAIDAHREALAGAPDRPAFMSNLGEALTRWFEFTDDADVIVEAVSLLRASAAATAHSTPNYAGRQSNLGTALTRCFERTADSSLLAESIRAHEQAVERGTEGRAGQSALHANLANALIIHAGGLPAPNANPSPRIPPAAAGTVCGPREPVAAADQADQPDPAPASFVKPIVTVGKVIAHDQSAVARLLDQYTSDALAVETEGHGFLEAAYMNPEVDALVIRGISDLLTGKDKASDDYWQPIASRHAAAFAVELLDSIGTSQP